MSDGADDEVPVEGFTPRSPPVAHDVPTDEETGDDPPPPAAEGPKASPGLTSGVGGGGIETPSPWKAGDPDPDLRLGPLPRILDDDEGGGGVGGGGTAEGMQRVLVALAADAAADITAEEAAAALARLGEEPASRHMALLSAGAAAAVAAIVARAEDSAAAQIGGCAALWNLAFTEAGEAALHAAGAVPQVIECAGRFPEDYELVTTACAALAALGCSAVGQEALMAAGGVPFLLSALADASEEHPALRRWACTAVAFMVDDHAAAQEAVLEADGLQLVLGCAQGEAADHRTASAALLALEKLLGLPAARAAMLGPGSADGDEEQGHLIGIVLKCMACHLDTTAVQDHGLCILFLLTQGSSVGPTPPPPTPPSAHHYCPQPAARLDELAILKAANAVGAADAAAAAHPDEAGVQALVHFIRSALAHNRLQAAWHYCRGVLVDTVHQRAKSHAGRELARTTSALEAA